jgi:uncharacterized damage-inducible protein DinB
MMDGVRFDELLDYNAEETRRWEQWFSAHPAALDLRIDIADAGTVRRLLAHIFSVEMHYAEAVNETAGDLSALQKRIEAFSPGDIPALFALSHEATAKFREFCSRATGEDYSKPLEFGSRIKVTATKRKLITQALTHSMRHWAQLATALRQQGLKSDWVHDFLLSKAME